MNRPELYNRTVQILVDAYFNDTLEHGNCHACAVGNLVAANRGIKYKIETRTFSPLYGRNVWDVDCAYRWSQAVCTFDNAEQRVSLRNFEGDVKQQILDTGYNLSEVAKIEYAFETAKRGISDDEWMFNGLMEVVEVLDEIHENKDQSVTDTSKKRFHKQTV